MFIPQTRAMSYRSKHHDETIDLIRNQNPELKTKQTHILLLPELCPMSQNPGKGSELHIHYRAREYFLELFSLDRYINGYIEHMEVRDIEFLAQEVAKDCANALGEKVKVEAFINLEGVNQKQIIRTQAKPLPEFVATRVKTKGRAILTVGDEA